MSDSERQKELAYAALLLEKQLESYQRLHEEELQALWDALTELKARILALDPEGPVRQEEPSTPAGDEISVG